MLSPRVHPILKYGFLCYRNRQNLFITGKNVLTVMVPILINKDVFEPNYNVFNSGSKTTITFAPT